jgi:hypothetical protein
METAERRRAITLEVCIIIYMGREGDGKRRREEEKLYINTK